MTLSDVAADPMDAAIWPQLWRWLETQKRIEWDRLVLPKLAEDSVLARWCAGAFRSRLAQWRWAAR